MFYSEFCFYLLHLTYFVQQLSVICSRYICAFIYRVSQSKKPSGAAALLGLTDPEDRSSAILTTFYTTQRNNPEGLSLLQLVTEACCMGQGFFGQLTLR